MSYCRSYDCYYNCCDYWGDCPFYSSQCYYYYDSTITGGAIAGIVVGVFILLVFAGLAVYCCCQRYRERR